MPLCGIGANLTARCIGHASITEHKHKGDMRMNKTTHSPGPWIATRRTSRAPFDYHITQDWPTGAHIVTVHDEGGGRVHGDNARLIASAPDLLDALTDLVGGNGKEGDLFSTKAMDKARQAIAKARGEG